MRPEGCHGFVHHRVHIELVAHVAVSVRGAEFARQRTAGCVGHIGDDHFRAFPREAAHAGLANALRAAGDDDDPAMVAELNAGVCRRNVHAGMVRRDLTDAGQKMLHVAMALSTRVRVCEMR